MIGRLIVRFIDYLRNRMKKVVYFSYLVLAILLLLDAMPWVVDKSHAHTKLESVWSFWALFGFFACVLIIIVSKWYGHLGIMTREDYYDE